MNYYIFVNKEQQGPYSLEELRSRHIASDTLVWREGMEQWMPAWQVEDLRPLFETAQQAQTTPPPVQPAFAGNTQQGEGFAQQNPNNYTQQPETQQPQPKRSGCSKVLLGVLVVIALILFTLAATCPSRQDHEEAVKKEVSRLIEKSTENSGNDLFSTFGKMFASGLTNIAVEQLLDVHNYVLWSVGEVHYGGHTKNVSFGIFNHVFTFDADDLERAMKGDVNIQESEENSDDNTSTDDTNSSTDDNSQAEDTTSYN